MKITIVYFSKHGNTQAIAEEIAGAMEACGAVRLLPLDEVHEVPEGGVLILGAPTHRRKAPGEVQKWLSGLGERLEGAFVATFDTRYAMPRWKTGSAARQMMRKLKRSGGRELLHPESFLVAEREGPLEADERERARHWAETLCAALRARLAQ